MGCFMRLPKLNDVRTVFIVGGGPSVGGVTVGEWAGIHRHGTVLACNAAMWTLPSGVAKFGVFGDKPFHKVFRAELEAFMAKGGRVIDATGRPMEKRNEWMAESQARMWRVQRRNRSEYWGIIKDDPVTADPTVVAWNRSVGGCALNVAVNMGARELVLIGFDMQMNGGRHNFHAEYLPHYQSGALPEPGRGHYKRHFLRPFPRIAEDLQRMKIPCWNTNRDSAIKDFPYRPLEDLLRWAG